MERHPQPITEYVCADGAHIVKTWPEYIDISAALLDHPEDGLIVREADRITFRMANGAATYAIDRESIDPSLCPGAVYECHRISSELMQAA